MQYYHVNPKLIRHEIIGNSTRDNSLGSILADLSYIKVDDEGLVYYTSGKPVPRIRTAFDAPEQLKIDKHQLETLFVKCDEPKVRKISNVRYVVGVDCGAISGFQGCGVFSDVEDALERCEELLNDRPDENYTVRIAFDCN